MRVHRHPAPQAIASETAIMAIATGVSTCHSSL